MLAGRHTNFLATSERAKLPLASARDRLAGVVEDDDLLLDRLARTEDVILAGEPVGLAGDVGQQRPVVAQQGLAVGRRDPVRAIEGHVHAFVSLIDVVRAEARPLELVPVHGQLAAAAIDAVAQAPEVAEFPGRGRGDAPGAERPQVVGKIHPDHRMPIGEPRRSHLVGIIPAMPAPAGAQLPGLPAQVGLLHFADLIGAVAKELGIPLGHAELPGHAGVAEGAAGLCTSRGTWPSPR